MNKVKYPMEAFALAMVLFSTKMKEAMLVGIALIVGDVLLSVLSEKNKDTKTVAAIGVIGTFIALVVSFALTSSSLETMTCVKLAALSALTAKHVFDKTEEENDYNEQLFNDSMAYLALVLVAIVREYLASANIYGFALSKPAFGSAALAQPMCGLIFAGLTLALLNKGLKASSNKDAALLVCVPTILLATPFVWKNVPEIVGMFVGMAVVTVMYVTFRQKLVFSTVNESEASRDIPVELVLLGLIYMVVTIL